MNVIPGSLPSLAPPPPEGAGAGSGLLAPGSLSRGAAAAAAAGIAAAADAFRSVLVADPGRTSSLGGARAGGAGWAVSPGARDASEPAGYASGGGAAPPETPNPNPSSTSASTLTASSTLTAKRSSSRSSTAKKTTASSSSGRGEYAFLDDKKISIEEKLFRFMKITQQKGDAELVRLMKNYRELHGTSARSGSTGGSGGGEPAPKQDEGGGLFGFLGDVVGLVGGAAAKLVGQAGGPLLAAAVTALGQPELVPVALAVGGEVGKAVGGVLSDALGADSAKRTSSSSSSGSSGSSSSDVGSPDEKLDMLEIQRAVEKQNQMFTLISNILKSLHDTGMSEINNIR